MATKVKECTCKHDFQDKEYGKNMRVFNVSENKDYSKCTICGAVHVEKDRK